MKKRKKKKNMKKRLRWPRIIAVFLILIGLVILNREQTEEVALVEEIEEESELVLMIENEENDVVIVELEEIEDAKKEEINMEELEEEIMNYLISNNIDDSTVSYVIENLSSETKIQKNEEEFFTAASIYKLPLAMLYYDKIYNGEVTSSTKYEYLTKYNEDMGVIASNYTAGSMISLEYILEVMIVYSDNTSGHLLFEELGGWGEYQKQLGIYSDYEFDNEFFERSKNETNSKYISDALKTIYENEEKYEKLLDDLKIATRDQYLDVGVDVDVAQKYGQYSTALNIAGIVFTDIPYSICILTSLGTEKGTEVVEDINQICYKMFFENVD